jgi:hypothetical protein
MESVPRSSKDQDRFFIDNTFFRGGWAGKLGPYAIAVYSAIALHADSKSQEAWPSHATIARLTGMSARQVIREVERLESYNIVSVKSRQEERKPALITLLDKSAWKPIDGEHMTGSHMPDSHKPGSHMTDSHMTYDSESDEHMTPSHTNKTHITKPNNKISSNDDSGQKPPEDSAGVSTEGTTEKWNKANKTIVGNKFLELTRLKPPNPKSKTAGAWWGWLYEIFEMAGKDSAETCRIMGIVVKYMRQRHSDITSPKSLLNYSRVVASGQELSNYQNGTSYGPANPRASPKSQLTPEEEIAKYLALKKQQEESSV